MPAARVTISEVDLSTRAPSFPGVYAAIVLPSPRGSTEEVTFLTSEKDLLAKFTPNNSIDVGFSQAFYSASAYLSKSDKLWAVRAKAPNMFHSAAAIKSTTSPHSNFATPIGPEVPADYMFDGQPDIPGVAEQTRYTTTDATGLDGKYILLYDSIGSVAFWFDVDNSGTPEPAHGAARSVPVTTIATGDLAASVASKLQAVIDSDSQFGAVVENTNEILVTDVNDGARAFPGTAGTTAFTVAQDTAGVTEVNAIDEALLIYADSQGVWGDGYGITIEDNSAVEPDSFLVKVIKAGTVNPLETHLCSRIEAKKDGDGNNIFVENVLLGSSYIRGLSNFAIDENIQPKEQPTLLLLGGGADGDPITDGNLITALDFFANDDEVILSLVMDGGQATPAYGNALITFAENRGDTASIHSTPISAENSANYLADIVDYRKTIWNPNSSYAALYTPHVKIYDRFNDRDIFVPPDGYAAAAISASASNFEIWFPAAGFTRGLLTVSGLRRMFNQSERDLLYDSGINPIRFAAGKGVAIWGQKTLLARPSKLDRLNVRLLFNEMKPAINTILETYLFDLNDDLTALLIETNLNTYLADIQTRRGLTDFLVQIDSDGENTISVKLFVKPTGSTEFIEVDLIITPSGVDFSLLTT